MKYLIGMVVVAILSMLVVSNAVRATVPIDLPPGVTATWLGDNTWEVVGTISDTSTPAGTSMTVTGEATYYRDGSTTPETVKAESLTMTVGDTSCQKVWLSTTKVPLTVVSVSEGAAEITPEGKLKYSITAKNDGKPATVRFKIKRVL